VKCKETIPKGSLRYRNEVGVARTYAHLRCVPLRHARAHLADGLLAAAALSAEHQASVRAAFEGLCAEGSNRRAPVPPAPGGPEPACPFPNGEFVFRGKREKPPKCPGCKEPVAAGVLRFRKRNSLSAKGSSYHHLGCVKEPTAGRLLEGNFAGTNYAELDAGDRRVVKQAMEERAGERALSSPAFVPTVGADGSVPATFADVVPKGALGMRPQPNTSSSHRPAMPVKDHDSALRYNIVARMLAFRGLPVLPARTDADHMSNCAVLKPVLEAELPAMSDEQRRAARNLYVRAK
jgi:hypothetical protein